MFLSTALRSFAMRPIVTTAAAAARLRPAAGARARPAAVRARVRPTASSDTTLCWSQDDPLIGMPKGTETVPISDETVKKAMAEPFPYFSDPNRSELIELFHRKATLLVNGGMRSAPTARSFYIAGERGIGKSLLLQSIVLALGQMDHGLLPIYVDAQCCQKPVTEILRHAANVRGWKVPTGATVRQMLRSLQPQGPNKQVKVVLVIDEAEELWKKASDATEQNLSDVYALATDYDCHSFVVLTGSYPLNSLLKHDASDAALEKMYPGVASGFDMNDTKIIEYPFTLSSDWKDVRARILGITDGPPLHAITHRLKIASKSNEPGTEDRVAGFINFVTGGNPRAVSRIMTDKPVRRVRTGFVRALQQEIADAALQAANLAPKRDEIMFFDATNFAHQFFREIPGLSATRLAELIANHPKFCQFDGAAFDIMVRDGQFRYTDAGLVTAPTPLQLAQWMRVRSTDSRPAKVDSRTVKQINGLLSVAKKVLKRASFVSNVLPQSYSC